MKPSTIPADLATLAHAVPGQAVEVRAVLAGAEPQRGEFSPGDRLVCRGVSHGGLIVTTAVGVDVQVPWPAAHAVQIERDVARPRAAATPIHARSAALLAATPPAVRVPPRGVAHALRLPRPAAGVGAP